MSEVSDLIRRNRSCRRFQQERRLSRQDLLDLIEQARLTATHRNSQELLFLPVWREEQCAALFPHLSFAAALGPAGRPAEGQRPAAYIAILGQSREQDFLWVDVGMACQSMLLAAVERGWNGCVLGGLQRAALRPLLGLGEDDPPILVLLALGYAGEELRLEEAAGDPPQLKYWREGDVHHVPKLPLSALVLEREPQ